MHEANKRWWAHCRDLYPSFFTGRRVLEVGSCDINGSVKSFFDTTDYTGVDWRDGPGVSNVCLAHEMFFPETFEVVISASMLEHDPYYEKSLPVMVKQLRETGLFLLSWGAALNAPHNLDTAPDGLFHALPAGRVLKILSDQKLYVHEFWYEKNMPWYEGGPGEVCLLGFKDSSLAVGERHLDELLPEDSCG